MPKIGLAKRVLGITFADRSLTVAQVTNGSEPTRIARIAHFVFPAELSLDHPEELGIALGEFLEREGFTARHVVLGVPAKWLVLKPHQLPPADPSTAAHMLWIIATEKIPTELGVMVFDYTGQTSVVQPSTVLLMGLQERWITRLKTVVEKAGRKAIAITPSAQPLCTAGGTDVEQSLILSLRPEGAELVAHDGSLLRTLRHLGSPGSAGVTTELRRSAAVASNAHGAASGQQLLVWDEIGLEPTGFDALAVAVGRPAVRGKLQWFDAAAVSPPDSAKGASAVALALSTRSDQPRCVDFLHPRIAPLKSSSLSPLATRLWIGAAAAAIVLLIAFFDINHLQRKISASEQQLQTLKPALAVAEPFVTSMQFAESFQTRHPRYLACLSDLTAAVPPEGQTYFTSLNLKSDMKGSVVGHCAGQQEMLALRDKLAAAGRFSSLNCKLNGNETRGGNPETSFFLSFTYIPRT